MPARFNPNKKGNTIIVINNDINRAISKLRHISAPLIKELKDKRYFEKPCAKRRRKKKEGIANMRKRQRMLKEMY